MRRLGKNQKSVSERKNLGSTQTTWAIRLINMSIRVAPVAKHKEWDEIVKIGKPDFSG